jgi:putative sterol carrier protein
MDRFAEEAAAPSLPLEIRTAHRNERIEGRAGRPVSKLSPRAARLAAMVRPSMADTPAEVEAIFRSLPARLRPDRAQDYAGIFHWDITGAAKPHWTVAIDHGTCNVREGFEGDPLCTVTMSEKTFIGVETGARNPVFAFVKGKIKVTNVGQLRRYDRAFYKFHDVPEELAQESR